MRQELNHKDTKGTKGHKVHSLWPFVFLVALW
jgi:hypothetical protein